MLDFRHQRSRPSASAVYPCGGSRTLPCVSGGFMPCRIGKDLAVWTWRDPEVIKRLLTTPATWAVIGLSANTERTAYSIGQYLRDRLGMSIVPVNLRGEDALGARGYRRLAEVPGSVQVVDCFVNSQRVGAVVDQAIAEKARLGIEAVWLQLGVIDEAAAERASAVGLDVVMNTCPAMEAPPAAAN
jgi:predicted CoA-binding protein